MEQLKKIVAFLDKELKLTEFDDSSNNGLQVENAGRVSSICCGVDASMEFFKEAKRRGADFLLCHHGISWGDSLKRITGLNYGRVAFLLKNDMALYACHLPLDAHPRYGNNVQICRELGLTGVRRFGTHGGVEIGFEGRLPRPMRYENFKKRVCRVMGNEIRTMDFGRKTVTSVAVVSGAASQDVCEAGQKGIHVCLSGEPRLDAYSMAQEYGINAVFAGHYATEVFGVREFASVLKRKFKIRSEFVDLRICY